MEGQHSPGDALGCVTVVAAFVELVCGECILDSKGSEDRALQYGSWWRSGGTDPRCAMLALIWMAKP